jgi:hypothetical protein
VAQFATAEISILPKTVRAFAPQLGNSRLRPRHKLGGDPRRQFGLRWPTAAPSRLPGLIGILLSVSPSSQGLDFLRFAHPGRDPSSARLSAARKAVNLASRLFGSHVGKPSLAAFAHGGERPRLAIISQGSGAPPAMKATTLFAGYWPLPAEPVTVPYTGAAPLPVLAVGSGFRHRNCFHRARWRFLCGSSVEVNLK